MSQNQLFIAWNGAIPTTGAQVPVTLTNAPKTQLQVTASSTGLMTLLGWGFSMNGSATPAVDLGIQVECLASGTIAGTGMTAVVPTIYGNPGDNASNATAGFTPSAEGTISAVRMFDSEFQQKLGGYTYQFPLGREPVIASSQVVRIRTNTPVLAAYPGILTYLIWAE